MVECARAEGQCAGGVQSVRVRVRARFARVRVRFARVRRAEWPYATPRKRPVWSPPCGRSRQIAGGLALLTPPHDEGNCLFGEPVLG